MLLASARPKAIVSPAAAAYFAIFSVKRSASSRALRFISSMTLTNAMNRISMLLSIQFVVAL
jgi:hypothetical protein